MRTFCVFYGGKWKLARYYGPPQYEHVIEPTAGFAGYSTYWEPKFVTLVERDPVIAGIWRYLIKATAKEILSLPVDIDSLDELPSSVCQEARDLIGFWFNRRCIKPAKRRGNWARSARNHLLFWDSPIRYRIASQVEKIRHWRVIEGDYTAAPNIEAHWFVDPPYEVAGVSYTHNQLDRTALAQWCRARKGFVHVCENDGATWLPLEPFALVNSPRGRGRAHGYRPKRSGNRIRAVRRLSGCPHDHASTPASLPARCP